MSSGREPCESAWSLLSRAIFCQDQLDSATEPAVPGGLSSNGFKLRQWEFSRRRHRRNCPATGTAARRLNRKNKGQGEPGRHLLMIAAGEIFVDLRAAAISQAA